MVIELPPISNRRDLVQWLHETLSFLDIKPRKKLSQVFMIEPRILKHIVEIVKHSKSLRSIVEIGAGLGTLTRALAEELSYSYIVAIEIDPRFVPILKELQHTFVNLDIVIGDALQLLSCLRSIDVVVGNIPYHITSDLLVSIARSEVDRAVITIQRDVAERLMAKPGSDNYGKISILIQALFDVSIERIVSATCFRPIPEVDSAIVVLDRKRKYSDEVAKLEKLILCLFSYRRKLLAKALRSCLSDRELDCVVKLGGNLWERMRVYQLDVEKALAIASICVES